MTIADTSTHLPHALFGVVATTRCYDPKAIEVAKAKAKGLNLPMLTA